MIQKMFEKVAEPVSKHTCLILRDETSLCNQERRGDDSSHLVEQIEGLKLAYKKWIHNLLYLQQISQERR